MIIVNDEAVLALEDESYTRLDANSTIWIRRGGTLYIQDGAVLEVGGPSNPGFAEVIVEDGGYICIDPEADVHFFAHPNDSNDDNVFYIANGFRGAQANEGVNMDAADGIFQNGGMYYGLPDCQHLCSLQNNNVVANPEYGWFNLGTPVAWLGHGGWMSEGGGDPDTMCVGDSMMLFGKYTLNESWFQIEICKWNGDECDPGQHLFINTCDTGRIGQCNLADKFEWACNETYRIGITVYNQCGDSDQVYRLINMRCPPVATFTVDSLACPGIETIIVNPSGSYGGSWHEWTIEPYIITDSVPANYDEKADNLVDSNYAFNGTTAGTFDFPNYYVKGGHHYIITLTIHDRCSTVTHSDTVYVPLAATILNDTPIVIYTDCAGPDSVILFGEISGADTFVWKKRAVGSSTYTTLGSASLEMEAQETTDYYYYLEAWNDTCSEVDSVLITVNAYANAGKDTVICRGDSVWIGVSCSLPGGYSSKWRPGYNIQDSTAKRTRVWPDSTVTYTLYVYNGATLVETDEVTVYVDSAAQADFAFSSVVPYEYCFDNMSAFSPATSYLWIFGDGDSSTETNPCHIYENLGYDTTYWACLIAMNSCDADTFCDSVFVPGDTATFAELLPVYLGNRAQEIDRNGNQPLKQSARVSRLLGNIPNPANHKTTINYELADDVRTAQIVITSVTGQLVKRINLPPGSSSTEVDCSKLAAGIYIYKLYVNGAAVGVSKMAVQR